MLDIVPSCYPVQYQGKLMMQTLENGGKNNFGPNFGSQFFFAVLPLLVARHCFKLYLCDLKGKNLISGSFWPKSPPPLPQFFSWVHRIQSWENLVTDGRTDRRTTLLSQDTVRLMSSVQNTNQFTFIKVLFPNFSHYIEKCDFS